MLKSSKLKNIKQESSSNNQVESSNSLLTGQKIIEENLISNEEDS
jgi:hypothetical protein